MSWRSITDHKLRSALTTLGVIIGVAAVIAFVTLGASLQADIVQTLAGDTTDVMYVSAESQTEGEIGVLPSRGQAVFTDRDVDRIRRIDGVENAVPVGGFATAGVAHGDDTVGRQFVTVTTPGYFGVNDQTIVAGRTFRSGQREVVVNQQAARMFRGNVSVGDEITFTRAGSGEELNATVVGIAKSPDRSGRVQSLVGDDRPAIYAPADPYYERTVIAPSTRSEQRVYAQVLVRVDDVERIEAVQGRVYSYLTQRSDARVLKAQGNQFEVLTHEQIVDQIERISATFTAYITGVAVISLVVGAIGIANIILVSVTERTREIGVMKAIGARRRDIIQLFLLEAILLGLLGSAIGSVVGLASGALATAVIGLPLEVRPIWFVVAVVVGLLVGIASGLYPAWSAARTDPIEALRHE